MTIKKNKSKKPGIGPDAREMFREHGRQGGKKTLKKYGKQHFRNISRKRWEDKM